jgi:predicted transcriptional regulator
MPEVKRVSSNVSLPEDMNVRLEREAEERDLSKSKIIERALPMLFEKWDALKTAEVAAERAAAKPSAT